MITDGFLYLATLIFIAAVLICLPMIFKGKVAKNVFKFAPPHRFDLSRLDGALYRQAMGSRIDGGGLFGD